ncbi:uncharacterized protein [Cardiocondyla obscurior]|uniref:uncharacterized protein n=1 Tax=Cardiocondyla obscurior TaxID=286306 RepID=UPI0039657074
MKIQAENKRTYNRNRKEAINYQIGDIVAVRRTQSGPGLKICPKFLGLYKVIGALRHARYIVEKVGNHEGPKRTSTAADYMKRWPRNHPWDSDVDLPEEREINDVDGIEGDAIVSMAECGTSGCNGLADFGRDRDVTNMKHIYNDHVNTDMSFKDFDKLCRICWQQKYGFVVIDTDSAISNGRYRKGFNDFVSSTYDNNNSELKNREIIAKKIAQTSDSIRKKYHAMKTGKMEEDIALERHFKPIVEPLKQIVENTVENNEVESAISKNESYFPEKKIRLTPKRKRSNATSPITASTPIKSALKRSHTIPSTLNETPKFVQQRNFLSRERSHSHSIEDVFDTADEPLVTSIRQKLQTSEGWKTLQTHYGPLGQKYLGAVLSGKKSINIDSVYGVYFNDNGTMTGNKRVDLDKNDNILIDGKKYLGTVGLYELIFMRFPDESSYTDTDKKNYKSILMATNAHKRDYNSQNQVKSNKGHKYKNIIAPVLSKKIGQGIPYAVTLNNNKIDYVYWDDPNELVNRLRLLEASRYAGHNAHDNEILSIIEELCEVGLIIN